MTTPQRADAPAWTPEPWQASDNESDTHPSFHDVEYGHSVAMSASDYERAIACVNALAGIPDPAAHIRTLEEQVARLTAERCALAWPENFDPPTGLIPCQCCGKGVVEFSIPSPLWNAVVRRGGPEGDREYLCIACWHSAVAAALASGGQDAKAGGA